MPLKLDLHIHSRHSGEAFGTIGEIILAAKSKELDGIALTDHNSIAGNKEAVKLGKKHGILVIPSCEIKSVSGDIIALNIKRKIPCGLSVEETIRRIHKQKALAVAAHPFAILLHPYGGVAERIHGNRFDAIEVFNARTFIGNTKSMKIAEKLQLPKVAGSDAHTIEEIGNAYVIVNCEKTIASVLREIKAGRTEICGENAKKRSILKWVGKKFAKRRLGVALSL